MDSIQAGIVQKSRAVTDLSIIDNLQSLVYKLSYNDFLLEKWRGNYNFFHGEVYNDTMKSIEDIRHNYFLPSLPWQSKNFFHASSYQLDIPQQFESYERLDPKNPQKMIRFLVTLITSAKQRPKLIHNSSLLLKHINVVGLKSLVLVFLATTSISKHNFAIKLLNDICKLHSI